MRLASTFVVLLAFYGSYSWAQSPTDWEKKGSSSEQTKKDYDECHYEAEKALGGAKSGLSKTYQRIRIIDQCMKLRGYQEPKK